jgi:hypothetical protein
VTDKAYEVNPVENPELASKRHPRARASVSGDDESVIPSPLS